MRWAVALVGGVVLHFAGCSTQTRSLVDAGPDAGPDGGLACNGALIAMPSSIEFGGTAIQTSATQILTLSNCGTLDIGAIPEILGPQQALFGLDRPMGVSLTVPAMQSVQLRLTYSPLVASGRDEATLVLTMSDGGMLQIPLLGEALQSGLQILPGPLDFGVVPWGSALTMPLYFKDVGNATVTVPTLSVVNDNAIPGYEINQGSWPGGDLAPGESQEVDVTFQPKQVDWYSGAVVFGSDETSKVALTGYGGGPVINCTPLKLDFGNVNTGASATLPVVCTNMGRDVPGKPEWGLIFTLVATDNPLFTVQSDPDAGDEGTFAQPLPALQSVQFDVTYAPAPSQNGEDLGTLTIQSNATDGTATLPPQIKLSGGGPCTLQLYPTSMDFGQVPVGSTASGGITLTNIGGLECLVSELALGSPCSSSFDLPNPPSAPQAIAADGGALSIRIDFTPSDAGSYSCSFDVQAGVGVPAISVPIVAQGI
jgi:hypothetical protein